jgi:superfamily II DNA or RNA helicase
LRAALSAEGEWLPHVLRQAHDRLAAMRADHPEAGGLVIATDQDHAHAVAGLLRHRLGVPADVVVSDDPGASARIAAFATSSEPWLVSVRMVSEGVDIPRLRVGVYATTVSTELFFRQAVGRFVRWQSGRASQKAYVYIPDDPRLRAHAFQIADARRHVLRPPAPEDDAVETGRPEHDAPFDEPVRDEAPEQLSLFSVLSAVATDMRIHAVTHIGLQFDDEPDQPEPADDITQGMALDLPEIPTDAGWAPDGARSVAEIKDELRDRNAQIALRLVDRTGWSHARVNGELNRLAGVTAVSSATIDQLRRRAEKGSAWLQRLR